MRQHARQPQVSNQALARRFLAADRLAELEGYVHNRAYWLGICDQYGVPAEDVDAILQSVSLRDLYRLAGRPDPAPDAWWRRALRAIGVTT